MLPNLKGLEISVLPVPRVPKNHSVCVCVCVCVCVLGGHLEVVLAG